MGLARAPAAKPAPPRPEAAPLEEKSSARGPWRIRFWGKDKSSNCMSFVDRDRLIVVDAGTGMEALTLEGVEPGVKDVWLLLTHYHQDHVAALEHARRWIQAGLRFHVVGPAETESILARVVERALPSVPVDVRPLWEGAFDGLPGLQVKALYTMHPGACFAYSFEAPGRSAIFAPDSEIPPDGGSGAADNTEKLASFALGADLLVHDARYSDDDYPGFAGRGHSCPRAALELALRAGVRTLVLCHVDAKYSAEERARALAAIRARGDPDMTLGACLLAESGLEIEL
ncbi:MAG: MBL fold metallo-hydrolase [Elusimicrobiota bacterium]